MNERRTEYLLQQCKNEIERNRSERYPENFPAIPSIPTGRYFDPEFFALEKQHLWPKCWLYAGFANELPEVGSFKLWERTGDSIVLVRGKDMTIRAFYNTCRHRGGALVKQDFGLVRNLVCKFHGWTYDLEGRLKGVPFKHDFADLESVESGLMPLRCEMWGNMIFVNKDSEAKPLLESLGPLVGDFEDAGLERRNVFKVLTRPVRCNWKVMLDAFAEGYHIDVVHPKTVGAFGDNRGTFIELFQNGHSSMFIPMKPSEVADSLPTPISAESATSPEHRITRETISTYTVFPNIIVTQAEFQYAYIAFWPTGESTTDIEVIFTAPKGLDDPESAINQAAVSIYDTILLEDTDNLSWLQKSIESGVNKAVPISYNERRLYQVAEEIDRGIGTERIPEHLRVSPVLDPHYEDPYCG